MSDDFVSIQFVYELAYLQKYVSTSKEHLIT